MVMAIVMAMAMAINLRHGMALTYCGGKSGIVIGTFE